MKIHHTVALLLLLCQKAVLNTSSTCPQLCQCFSATTIICSDPLTKTLPEDIPSQTTALIMVTSGLRKITIQEHLRNLTKLVFLSNPLQNVSQDTFKALTSLEELEISGCPLLFLKPGAFYGLDQVTKLLLNNNNKFMLSTPNIFDPLEKLETLQLRGNMLKYLHTDIFNKLYNLQELNLSSNNLLTICTRTLTKLKKLDLGLNRISCLLQNTLSGNSQLQVLSLQGNRINQIFPGTFTQLENLEELNLGDNNITQLAEGLFPLNLKKLTLKGNSLNRLSSSAFTGLYNLTHLDLSQSKLFFLPSELFQGLSSLEHLDLSENFLQELPGILFHGLFQISILDLQKNKLTSLEAELFKDQKNMSRLRLARNRLENLPYGIFDPLDFECLLQLHGNPWRCDCNLQSFHNWLDYFSKTVEDLSQVYCTNPYDLQGISLTTVSKEQLVCTNRSFSETSHIVNQATSVDSDRQCNLQEANGAIVVICNLMKCSDVKLDVCFHHTDGGKFNYTLTEPWPGSFQCFNGTVVLTV